MNQFVQECANNPRQRLLTAKHELAHGLVAFAMGGENIDMRVFHKPKRITTPYSTHWALGVCGYRFCVIYMNAMEAFCTAAPYASPLYPPDPNDKGEFFYAAEVFQRATGLKGKHFNTFVLEPLKEYLESKPIMEITNYLTEPLARVGRLRVKANAELEKFFPKGTSLPYVRVLARNLREKLSDYPFVRGT